MLGLPDIAWMSTCQKAQSSPIVFWMQVDAIKCLNAGVIYCPKSLHLASQHCQNTPAGELPGNYKACLSIKWGGQVQGPQPHKAPSDVILYTTIVVGFNGFPVCLHDFKRQALKNHQEACGMASSCISHMPSSSPKASPLVNRGRVERLLVYKMGGVVPGSLIQLPPTKGILYTSIVWGMLGLPDIAWMSTCQKGPE